MACIVKDDAGEAIVVVAETGEAADVPHDEERYRQLLQLLNRSKFYTKYLEEKIESGQKRTKKLPVKNHTVSGSEKETKKRARTNIAVTAKRRKLNDGTSVERLVGDATQPALLEGTNLRPYQLEGYNWLRVLYENGVNGILGDEMGLGKTVQSIAVLSHIIEMGIPGPFMICAPLSTLYNWQSEFQKFTPKIPVLLYHGGMEERKQLRVEMEKRVNIGFNSCFPIVITSYQIVINDCKFIRQRNWHYIIVDEGHRLKNHQCILLKCLKNIPSANRLLLTGTPLQNDLTELWSLLNFLVPEIFDNLNIFCSWFDLTALSKEGSEAFILAQEQEKKILATLHEILSPFLLRRVKSDVELTIPPKKEIVIYAPMTARQQQMYKTTVNKTIRNLIDNRNEIKLALGTIVMALRKSCNHPYMIEYPLCEGTEEYKMDEELVTNSGKMLILDLLLKKLFSHGHKVVIFSQFTTMLDILQDYCFIRNYTFCRIDGNTRINDRNIQIKQFNEDDDKVVFLLCTRAGGLGINLTAADTVIIYDSDWNPQCDLQAMDRCHRIGQNKPVIVVRLVTENTIDQQIVVRASSKRKLEKIVIHKDLFKKNGRHSTALDPVELLEMLKSNDHDGVIYSNKDELLSDDELGMLMDRSFTNSNWKSIEGKTSRIHVLDSSESRS